MITWAALDGASAGDADSAQAEDVARAFIRAAWSVMDVDADGEVTFAEFTRGTFLAVVALESRDDRLLHELSFRVMDLDNNGAISRPEMLYWVEWLVKTGALAADGPPANFAMQRRASMAASEGAPPAAAEAESGESGEGAEGAEGGQQRTGHTDQEVARAHRGVRPRKDRKKHGNKMASGVNSADAWCDALLSSMDKNHDGQISFDEWMELQDVLPIAQCIITRVNGTEDGAGAVFRLLIDAAGHHDD